MDQDIPATGPHILVVDDNRELRDVVARLLVKDNFRVTTADSAPTLRALLFGDGASLPDLLVLDLMLPGEDGLALCRSLRATPETAALPIIMLTARGDEIDRVLGLEMGADDYIAKPFSGRELVARIRAVLRRSSPAPQGSAAPPAAPPAIDREDYQFHRWRLNTAQRHLETEDGSITPLSTGEYDLLLVFVQRPQRVLNRDQLLDLARGRTSTAFDRSIDTQVSRLRRKIEPDPKTPDLIKTVWGGGYLFTPRVERIAVPEAGPSDR